MSNAANMFLFSAQTVSAVQLVLWITHAGQIPGLEPASVNRVSLVNTVTPALLVSMDSTVRVREKNILALQQMIIFITLS